MLIDSHAHLDDARFAGDLEAVLQRAREAGVVRVLTMGTSLASCYAAVDLAHRFPMVLAAVGIHPHRAREVDDNTWRELARLVRDARVVAIGEIGLDYHYNYSPPDVQQEVFRRQVRMAAEMGLPVVIHDREAHADVEAILYEAPPARTGVVHCFSGDAAMAERLLGNGFFISFAGPVTFASAAGHYRQVLPHIPLDRLLLETDCPYLTPAPYRGRRNEPAHVRLVAERVAAFLGRSVTEVVAATAAATANLFNLPPIGTGRNSPTDGE